MATPITQRELRNDSGRIMRALDDGESFLLTRNGVPVGELRPLRRRQFVPVDELREDLEGTAPVDAAGFFEDVDRGVDQDTEPRG